MGNALNKLETVLVSGLKQEVERLEKLDAAGRLNLLADASEDAVDTAYQILLRNYHPRNYAKHASEVVAVAEKLHNLLDEARNDLLGLDPYLEEEDITVSAEAEMAAEMAFAATQSSDDLPRDIESMEKELWRRQSSFPAPNVAAMNPASNPVAQAIPAGPSSVPPAHFAAPNAMPPTPPYPGPAFVTGSQDLTGSFPNQMANQAGGLGYPNPPQPQYSAPTNYPPPPSWDLPAAPYNSPHAASTNQHVAPLRTGDLPAIYPAANMPPPQMRPSDSVPTSGQFAPPPTGDLPVSIIQAEQRLRELTHRLYATEAQLRSIARTSQEQRHLLESQARVAESRARASELRVEQLEHELREIRSSDYATTARPAFQS